MGNFLMAVAVGFMVTLCLGFLSKERMQEPWWPFFAGGLFGLFFVPGLFGILGSIILAGVGWAVASILIQKL